MRKAMTDYICTNGGTRLARERGASMVELALLLPLLVIMAFGIIDFGRLIQARLVVTNISREGADLLSRDINTGTNLINLLLASDSPIDINNEGKIYATVIKAGTSTDPQPTIDIATQPRPAGGALNRPSSIVGNPGQHPTGWLETSPLYSRLAYDTTNKTSDISQIAVVEVYYFYTPITPLPGFIAGLFPDTLVVNGQNKNGLIIGSRAVF
jgi:hypothetical protein